MNHKRLKSEKHSALSSLEDVAASLKIALARDGAETHLEIADLVKARRHRHAAFARARARMEKAIMRFARHVEHAAKRQLATRARIDSRLARDRTAALRAEIHKHT
jgi:hypothetical protein